MTDVSYSRILPAWKNLLSQMQQTLAHSKALALNFLERQASLVLDCDLKRQKCNYVESFLRRSIT